jgi:1-aminocyclopropane-1-carboxylate deaminase
VISYTEPGFSEQEIDGVRLLVLREYENHPLVSGNKWWKLKNNLEEARKTGCHTLLTFGGAYSNHIYATAAAAKLGGFRSIGIIRGEEVDNPVLNFARSQGMELRFISREGYRKKEVEEVPGVFVIPEGGTNQQAVAACAEWGRKLLKIEFDQVYLAVGTGGTMGGLIIGLNGERELVGVAVLKNGGFIEEDVECMIEGGPESIVSRGIRGGEADDTRREKSKERSELRKRRMELDKARMDLNEGRTESNKWKMLNDYHFGGYAKKTKELEKFCDDFKLVPIEPVYTGKLFWAVVDQIRKGNIKKGTTVLVIHTGGINSLLSREAR